MRYSELIENNVTVKAPLTADPKCKAKTKLIRIPAGAGPVRIYIRDGKLFVISDQPLERSTLP